MQRRLCAVTFAAIVLAGCSMAPQAVERDAVTTLPERYERAGVAAAESQEYWWRTFGDERLERLVDSALVRNLDLRLAVARVEEMHAIYRIARGERLPAVQLSAQRDAQNTPSNIGIGGQLRGNMPAEGVSPFPDRFDFSTYSASLGFSYEFDFWGRVAGSKRAAVRDVLASEADVRTALVGVISETIATYFEINERRQTLELTRQSTKLLEERLELTEGRYRHGLGSSHELYGIRQRFLETRAGIPVLESQLEDAWGRLGLILGRHDVPRDTVSANTGETHALEPIPAGLPSDLLKERPDVVAAFQRLEAARERVGVARAARFPRFALTGAGGLQSGTLSDIARPDQNSWLLGSGLTAPIFNAGALRAREKAEWARYERQALQYEKTVLGAFREVASALEAYRKQQDRHAFVTASAEAARSNAAAFERRWSRGVGGYVGLLDARAGMVRAEMAEAASRRAEAVARLAVHRALGGAWISTES